MVQENSHFLSSVSQAGSEYGGDRSPGQKLPTKNLKDAYNNAFSEHGDINGGLQLARRASAPRMERQKVERDDDDRRSIASKSSNIEDPMVQ